MNGAARPEAREMVLALLARRDPTATICPSEVARALATAAGDPAAWRATMTAVHDAVDALAAAGVVRVSWKGVGMPVRKGAYRIGRGEVWRQRVGD